MGFFKSAPPPPPPASEIGPKTLLRGELTTTQAVVLEGAVEGGVATKASLTLAPGGRVEGKVHAERLDCAGAIRGEAVVDGTAVFQASASFSGELKAAALVVRSGARTEGRFARLTPRP